MAYRAGSGRKNSSRSAISTYTYFHPRSTVATRFVTMKKQVKSKMKN